MKINTDSFSAGALFTVLIATLSFFSGIAHADTCTPPTPPVCYGNVPIYQTTGVQANGDIVSPDGQWIIPSNGASNPSANSEYAQVDCTDDPTYQGELLTYNECLQLNSMNQSSADLQSSDNTATQQTDTPAPSDAQVCPYQVQPASQVSETVIATAEDPSGGGTVKEYSDGTYALFDALGRYERSTTENEFSLFKKAGRDYAVVTQGMVLGTDVSASAIEAASTLLNSDEEAIKQSLTNSSNCSDATPQPIAVTGVTLNESSNTLIVGGAADSLMVTILPDHVPDQATNQNVTWSSSDPSVASVHYGVVTAVAPGSAIITVTTVDGNFTATDAITVVDPVSDSATATNDSLVAQMKTYLATQGYTPPPAPTASNAAATIAQRRAALGMPPEQTTTHGAPHATTSVATATTTQTIASSTPAPAPKQKHWYEWLNPLNWFSWLR